MINLVQKGNIYALPAIHYNMEVAALVRRAFLALQPDCVAVELAEPMAPQLNAAVGRLPDLSVVLSHTKGLQPLYYMVEPCDASFEGMRSALEKGIPAYCIDLDVDNYPLYREPMPDPYAIQRIGLPSYYALWSKEQALVALQQDPLDQARELYMARRLKELSYSYERILFVCGMAHLAQVLKLVDSKSFIPQEHARRDHIELCTVTEKSALSVMAQCGWFSCHYEQWRAAYLDSPPEELILSFAAPDRQKLIYSLYKNASEQYVKNTGNAFPSYNMRNIMKFARNYALMGGQLLPDLYQIVTAAKGCVDHNYAYEAWALATQYPYRKNIDNIPELDLSVDEVWGHSKLIRFHMRQKSRKTLPFQHKRADKSQFKFDSSRFSICSYPPEDIVVENFGTFLRKKGIQLLSEEGAKTMPFSGSLEDGLDIRESLRHWHEKKLYVKMRGKPSGGVGSIVVIFHEDQPSEGEIYQEKYPWKATWLGEHSQESDMALYATPMAANVVGPGISRCEYGGFMMSYPPRRMTDVWNDHDYHECRSKAELLLVAAIDFALKPLVVYVAAKPPRTAVKNFAARYGKKIAYIPIGQLSPIMLNKIRVFHVLDGHDKRQGAAEYIT